MATSPSSEAILHLRRSVLLRDVAALTDEQLLEDYINHRNAAAITALVQRHASMVWGVCRRVLHNYHDVEDAFQATFLVLVRKAASIVSRELLANWLYGVAHQTALKARATAAKRKERESQMMKMPEPEVLEQDHWPDLQPLLDQELSRLPDKYRVVIILCDLEGKTRKEVAEQLGCPEGTVGGRLARARMMLAKRLARHGLAVSSGTLAVALSQRVALASAPISVVCSAIQAAILLSAGQAATGAISVEVATLTEGVLKAMLLTKLKIATAVLFVATTVALTCGVMAGQQPGLPDDAKAKPQIKPAEPTKVDKLQVALRHIDEPKYKPIDAETIAAYEKLGGEYGGFEPAQLGLVMFSAGEAEAKKGLPGFNFHELPEGKELPKFPPVKVPFGLDLSCPSMTDIGLKELKDLRNLHTLNLGFTSVGDEGLKELKELKNLNMLQLTRTKVTDAGLKELKELKNLTALELEFTQVTDEGLKELKELKNLARLDLNATKVIDDGLKELKDLKNLTALYFGFTMVTDAGLKELRDLKNLDFLYLYRTQVTDAGLKELKELKGLSFLLLNETQVTDVGLKELKDLKNLTHLGLHNTQVTDAGLKELTGLKNLRVLGLGDTKVTDKGVKELQEALPKCEIIR